MCKDLHNHSDGKPITIIATTIWLIYPVVEKSDCCNKLSGRYSTAWHIQTAARAGLQRVKDLIQKHSFDVKRCLHVLYLTQTT